jgi:hypothetical protein
MQNDSQEEPNKKALRPLREIKRENFAIFAIFVRDQK